MDHLIGQKFSLISKSEIRYVGILHEINPEQSTIALEDVYSFGTEDRKQGAEFIPASQQKFEYIVFRGSDVKDIKVADDQKENRQPEPPNVPNDPAILNSSRPSAAAQGPQQNRGQQPPQNFPPQGQQFTPYYSPYGYGPGGPPPGNFRPGPGFPPYGPPPGGPPGGPQGAPPGWFNAPQNPFPQPPGGFGPGNQFGPPGQRGSQNQQATGAQQKTTSELPVDGPSKSKPTTPQPPISAAAPTPPVDSKPTVPDAAAAPAPGKATAPTKKTGVTPAVPAMPAAQKAPVQTTTNGPVAKAPPTGPAAKGPVATNSAAMAEATRQATAAVAAAMAKLPQAGSQAKAAETTTTNAVDQLAQKVSQIRTSEPGQQRGRGRGRGRGGNFNHQNRKVDVPKDDYDFETANARFNKEDLIKEAIASGSPIGEGVTESGTNGTTEVSTANGLERKDSIPSAVAGTSAQAYNKSTSFFDNISSELKDREDAKSGDGRPGWRGEEIKKNIETFGQSSVDSGYRGGYRGRGRGRGYGRGGPRGYGGRGGGYRGRGRGGGETASAPAAPAQS